MGQGAAFDALHVKAAGTDLVHVPFEYYFYVQLVCPAGCDAAACNSLLETLTGACSTLRLLGAFTLDGIDQQ